jgi:hypothetical protein
VHRAQAGRAHAAAHLIVALQTAALVRERNCETHSPRLIHSPIVSWLCHMRYDVTATDGCSHDHELHAPVRNDEINVGGCEVSVSQKLQRRVDGARVEGTRCWVGRVQTTQPDVEYSEQSRVCVCTVWETSQGRRLHASASNSGWWVEVETRTADRHSPIATQRRRHRSRHSHRHQHTHT